MLNFSKNIYPKALKSGGHIAVISPASRDDGSRLVAAERFLTGLGYKISIHQQNKSVFHSFAGTDEERVSALHDVFADKSVDAIFCARGGNGSVYLLDKIDYNLVKQNPKIFVGYSDITALHAAIYKNTGLVTFHGPDFADFGVDGFDEYSLTSSLNLLSGQRSESIFESVQMNHPFSVTGHIVVGNLSLLTALLGTKWQANLNGAILMIEDIAEETSRIDRVLWQWRSAGHLDKIKALVIGRFSDMKDSGFFLYGLTMNEIVERHTIGLKIPIVSGVSFGHKGRNPAIPYGINARIIGKDSKLSLQFLSQVVD